MSAHALLVPKAPVSVELRDSLGRESAGEVYLGEREGARETLLGVLLDRRFVPVRDKDGALRLLNRDHLLWVRLDLLTALDEIDVTTEAAENSRVARVRVAFDDGTDLVGSVRYLRPTEHQRLSDYLSTTDSYFPVRTADHVYLVNRARVVAVMPIAEVTP